MSKKAIKKSERNTPVKKSIRVRKDKVAKADARMSLDEFRAWVDKAAEGSKKEYEAELADHGASEYGVGVAEAYASVYEHVAKRLRQVK